MSSSLAISAHSPPAQYLGLRQADSGWSVPYESMCELSRSRELPPSWSQPTGTSLLPNHAVSGLREQDRLYQPAVSGGIQQVQAFQASMISRKPTRQPAASSMQSRPIHPVHDSSPAA